MRTGVGFVGSVNSPPLQSIMRNLPGPFWRGRIKYVNPPSKTSDIAFMKPKQALTEDKGLSYL